MMPLVGISGFCILEVNLHCHHRSLRLMLPGLMPLAHSSAAPQVKMKELGVLGNVNYKIVCLLDHKVRKLIRSSLTAATSMVERFCCFAA
jgi:hypothetical protein